ncbi:uncharacterized protein LOC118152189 [Callithrix jacchus]
MAPRLRLRGASFEARFLGALWRFPDASADVCAGEGRPLWVTEFPTQAARVRRVRPGKWLAGGREALALVVECKSGAGQTLTFAGPQHSGVRCNPRKMGRTLPGNCIMDSET